MTDLILGTLLLVAVGAQAVVVMADFSHESRDTDWALRDWSGDR